MLSKENFIFATTCLAFSSLKMKNEFDIVLFNKIKLLFSHVVSAWDAACDRPYSERYKCASLRLCRLSLKWLAKYPLMILSLSRPDAGERKVKPPCERCLSI